jgi:hypothetical protein
METTPPNNSNDSKKENQSSPDGFAIFSKLSSYILKQAIGVDYSDEYYHSIKFGMTFFKPA